jgi:hypothetical protein
LLGSHTTARHRDRFDGDISPSETVRSKRVVLEGSDIMCIGCSGTNRIDGSNGPLIFINRHNIFGNKDRVVGNGILALTDFGQAYDAFIYDASRSSTIEANHIEGAIRGAECDPPGWGQSCRERQ